MDSSKRQTAAAYIFAASFFIMESTGFLAPVFPIAPLLPLPVRWRRAVEVAPEMQI
jgi:hypothetical protein